MIGGIDMHISRLQPVGRKIWVKKKWDEYEASKNTEAISNSEIAYNDPTNEELDGRIDKAKWKSTIDRKVDYLLARNPVMEKDQEALDNLLDFIKESARAYLLRGSLIWIVQGDGESIDPKPSIMSNTIAIYKDEHKEEVMAFIRKYTDLEIDAMTGEETEIVYYELYYEDQAGEWHRDTFNYEEDQERDKVETLSQAPMFIELGKTGDAPLYAYVKELLDAMDRALRHQDTTVEKNTSPLTEVRGYTATSTEDLQYAVEKLNLVKVDGNGGVTLHMRNMDSAAIDLWTKRIMQEYYEATSTVGKDNELLYAQSGKAMDRLFVDMENSARALAAVLEKALREYFKYIDGEEMDIIWNTDRPVDDIDIINGILSSRGLVSDRTLLEQHPWVDDVDEEIERRTEEVISGMDDLYEDDDWNDDDDYEQWEV